MRSRSTSATGAQLVGVPRSVKASIKSDSTGRADHGVKTARCRPAPRGIPPLVQASRSSVTSPNRPCEKIVSTTSLMLLSVNSRCGNSGSFVP